MAENANPTPESIREARAASGLTQSAAAALIGASLRAWSAWEVGGRNMPAAKFKLFRHLAGVERIGFAQPKKVRHTAG
jgi:DNA-binding transcriptional regulator YiaG